MIHFIAIDGTYHLIVIGSMQLAVALIGTDPFEVFADEVYPIFDRDEIATLEAAIELGRDAKGKRWNLTNGLLSGLNVDLNMLTKALYESRYLWYHHSYRHGMTMDDETLFVRYGKGIPTLGSEILPIIGITSKEFVKRDSDGHFRRTNANSV